MQGATLGNLCSNVEDLKEAVDQQEKNTDGTKWNTSLLQFKKSKLTRSIV